MADLSTLPDVLPWPFMVCSRKGEVLFANPLVERTVGRKVQVGTTIDRLFLELENGQPASTLLRSAARWSAWSGMLELRNDDIGEPIRAAKIILQPDPKFDRQVWLIFAEDPQINGTPILTPRSGMSLARTLIENSPDFIIFRDLQGRILHTSRSLDEFLSLPYRGYGADLTLADILSTKTAEQFRQFDEEVVRTGQRVLHAVMHFETQDRRSRLVRVVHERIKGGGGLPNGLLTFALNITESVDEHNRLRIALEKAEEVAAAKWQFVANVTHEIRNPINAIQGLCETNLEAATPAPPEVLRKIQSCARELEDTVRDVLDFSRLDRGNVTIESIPFNPVRALEEVIAQFQHQAGRKGVELAALVRADTPQSVLGDPIKFRRIIANLIGNAVKFTESGHVHAELDLEERNGRLRSLLTVRDTGIGIPADRLESIFEPFTQADATTTRRFGGTGLGLTIVRSLTQAMDGFMKVTSEVGVGSTFAATVMVEPNPALAAPPQPNLAGQRLLIVAGHPRVRQWFADTLSFWGATCVQTATYDEAEALPAFPREQVILVTSSEVEFRSQAQLFRPVTLTALWTRFSTIPPTLDDAEPAAGRLRASRRLRVLLAEDNEVNREVAGARLRRAGHEVSATVDGSAALDLWRSKEFDVAILDIQMPIMDGLSVAAAIRAEEQARGRRRTALLALTAMTQELDRARCEAAGFDAYLAKPVRGAELLEKLELLSASQEADLNRIRDDEFGAHLEAAETEDAEDLRAAARAFLRHADDILARLCAARDGGDADALGREAHGAKGMLSLMACAGLARLANQIERQPGENTARARTEELIDGLRKLRLTLQSRTDLSADAQAETQTRDQD
jgi:signal transduction histidine kinase/CheY-like chemotaxis protein